MIKKDIINKLEKFPDNTEVRFMFWTTSGINAFDDDVQISSRFLDSSTGELHDLNLGTNVDDSPFFVRNDIEPTKLLVYLFSPAQAKDVFNNLNAIKH